MVSPAPLPSSRPVSPGLWLAGRYEVQRNLGKGGFATVHLVYDHGTDRMFAFKVLRTELEHHETVRNRFRQEAQVWLDLGAHPHLVKAHFVDYVEGRWFLAIDYVAPDSKGCITLEDHLRAGPLPLDQALRWAIQCCYGMTFAYARGLQSHRDLKPANLLIEHGQVIKITDLGLARMLGDRDPLWEINLATMTDEVDLRVVTNLGQRIGTPTHMSPEQFAAAHLCDEVSDIYSFGVILFQMATGGQLPFHAPPPQVTSVEAIQKYVADLEAQHREGSAPRISSPLDPIIQQCLEKDRERRYVSFEALREALEALLWATTGTRIQTPHPGQQVPAGVIARGFSFYRLHDYTKALKAFEAALQFTESKAEGWHGKGLVMKSLGKLQEALSALNRACTLAPERPGLWVHRGEVLHRLGQYQEAIASYNAALDLDWRQLDALNDKGNAHYALGQYQEALFCYDMGSAIEEVQPGFWHNRTLAFMAQKAFAQARESAAEAIRQDHTWARAWVVSGYVELAFGAFEEADRRFQQALSLDPARFEAALGKGYLLAHAKRFQAADAYFEQAIQEDPTAAGAWMNRGVMRANLGDYSQAVQQLRAAARLQAHNPDIWYNLGTLYLQHHHSRQAVTSLLRAYEHKSDRAEALCYNLGLALQLEERYEEAVHRYREAEAGGLRMGSLWYNLGLCLAHLGRMEEGAAYFERVVEQGQDPQAQQHLACCLARDPIKAWERQRQETTGFEQPRMRPMPSFRLFRALAPIPFRQFPSRHPAYE